MGEVYRADDLKLGQPVALKFLPARLRATTLPARALPATRSAWRARSRIPTSAACTTSARPTASSSSPWSTWTARTSPRCCAASAACRRTRRIEIARQLCAGLAAAHDARRAPPRPQARQHHARRPAARSRITDFGLAGARGHGDAATTCGRGRRPTWRPSSCAGSEVTVRSDVYSLGLVLYELFTGKRAFDGRSSPSLKRQHERSRRRRPRPGRATSTRRSSAPSCAASRRSPRPAARRRSRWRRAAGRRSAGRRARGRRDAVAGAGGGGGRDRGPAAAHGGAAGGRRVRGCRPGGGARLAAHADRAGAVREAARGAGGPRARAARPPRPHRPPVRFRARVRGRCGRGGPSSSRARSSSTAGGFSNGTRAIRVRGQPSAAARKTPANTPPATARPCAAAGPGRARRGHQLGERLARRQGGGQRVAARQHGRDREGRARPGHELFSRHRITAVSTAASTPSTSDDGLGGGSTSCCWVSSRSAAPLERALAREQLVEHEAQRVDVAAHRDPRGRSSCSGAM